MARTCIVAGCNHKSFTYMITVKDAIIFSPPANTKDYPIQKKCNEYFQPQVTTGCSMAVTANFTSIQVLMNDGTYKPTTGYELTAAGAIKFTTCGKYKVTLTGTVSWYHNNGTAADYLAPNMHTGDTVVYAVCCVACTCKYPKMDRPAFGQFDAWCLAAT